MIRILHNLNQLLIKNVNKTPKFLQLYSTVDQNKEINLLISTVGTTIETSVKKNEIKFLSVGLMKVTSFIYGCQCWKLETRNLYKTTEQIKV